MPALLFRNTFVPADRPAAVAVGLCPPPLTAAGAVSGGGLTRLTSDLLRQRKRLNLQSVLASPSSTYRRVCLRRSALRAPWIFNRLHTLTTIAGEKPGLKTLAYG